MGVAIREETASSLAEYGRVPIAFTVTERLAIRVDEPLDGFRLVRERVTTPYDKDYDAEPDQRPVAWPRRFDVMHWGFFAAFDGSERVGGATVAWKTPDVDLLERRADLALLWDLRVTTARRGSGIGTLLLRAAEEWSRRQGAAWLKVETQNVNVAACTFYVRYGFQLGGINRFAYPTLPDEAQLLFYKDLLRSNATRGQGRDSDPEPQSDRNASVG
jgi:streptothricin acetyltransferase